ncbi:MAG TPA: phosphatidylserine/phosphatidylglycerophosphate/cardiolipin synthase family protein, partial [Methanothermobacter sp.]|nr:phosphatidylserine/phosphatidylglycerophosphate/cardiolipin synthase family protein [Methanothermobacter sp.]
PTRRSRPGVMEKLKTEIKPKKETPTKKPKKGKGTDFVKERLRSLKRRYMDDVEGVDAVIEERMSPFVGVLDKMKSTIIWSFDAFDVQDTMRDILTGANESIILMYPWIRNLDISILKKFMDTKSRVIIQEASLDDDASVELVKLLMDNNVDIRTMPHIHTVAAVVDNKKGLIISTDPIYDSFEVGVVYDDRRSIKEIEKLFEKAWSLSKEISIGG